MSESRGLLQRGRGGRGRRDSEEPGGGRRRAAAQWPGLRWVVPVRSLVVVLAMAAAALGVLWMETAGVQNASAQLATETAGKVAVPPLDSLSPAGKPVVEPKGEAATAPGASMPPGTGAPGALPAPIGTGAPGGQGGVAQLVVHVAGAVKKPGVYLLAPESRVFQAIDAAGGALPAAQLAALNLAAVLSDGLQVYVPTRDEAAQLAGPPGMQPGPAARSPGAGAPGNGAQGRINLNTASEAELDTLPGVGPVLAQRIVAWRTEHGPFTTVDGLDAVDGIGAKLLAGLRDLVVAP